MSQITEFKLDPRDGTATFERANGQVESFNLSNTVVRNPNTGSLQTPAGQVVGGGVADGVSANTDDSSTITNSRAIKNSAGRLTGIICTSGTSVVLTLYDNSVPAASGRQIYSGTLSAGDVVQPTNAWFAAGCYAAFTGSATFVITTSEAAQ